MNRTVLITGASSGIGKETAFVYAKNGYNLILVARRLANLEEIKQEIEDKLKVQVIVFAMDLSELNSAENLFKKVDNANLKIEVLINNAGFGIYKKFEDSSIEKEEQMLLLNMVTLTKLTKLVIPQMIERGYGNIVNIASVAAYQPIPTLATYAATKAYVMSFSEAIAFELKDKNVIVTAICPGATQSEFGVSAGYQKNSSVFKGKPTSKDLSQFIYKSMIAKKTNAIHGLMNNFLTFSARFSPRKLTTFIAYKMMNKT